MRIKAPAKPEPPEPAPPLPLLLNVQQVCAYLGISRTSVYKLRKLGLLRFADLDELGPQIARVHIRDAEECAERLRAGEAR